MFDWLFPAFSTCIVCNCEDICSLECGICKNCYNKLPFAKENDSTFYYKEPINGFVQNLKYNHKKYLAKILIKLSFEKLNKIDYDVICFVPTRNKKLRGYNQAEALAQAVCKDKCKDVIIKTRDTVSQTKLSARERISNVKDTFFVTDGSAVLGKRVLLIDDVRTTGATLDECKKELIKAGANSVVTFAICQANTQEHNI